MKPDFIRPDVAALLQAMPRLPLPPGNDTATVQRMRADILARGNVLDAAALALPVVRDLSMPGPAGPIPLRLYDSRAERPCSGPVVVFFHGGGFVLGDATTHDALCTAIAAGLDLPLVYVDYRLAPEHPWPGGPQDCEAAARWIAVNTPELGIAASALVLAGDSAGGCLALGTSVALRDRPAALPVAAQLALYPITDRTERHASGASNADGYLLTRDMLDWFYSCYQPPDDARAWPLLADQEGLPPTMIVTAGLDPLRDQGRAYAARLVQAGVATRYLEVAGTIHGWLTFRRAIAGAQADLDAILADFRALLAAAIHNNHPRHPA